MKKIKNPYSKLDLEKSTNPTRLDKNIGEEISSYLAKHPQSYVLNCGAGNTTLKDARVVHLDIFHYDLTDIISDANHLPFKENSFDAVFCHAVLEHVKYPFDIAKQFSKILKPKGYISASIPFLFPYHDIPDHYCNFSSSGIRVLFQDFTPLETGVLLGPWYALYNIIGNYKKMLKRVYKDPATSRAEKVRVFFIYTLLSWGMKFNHKTIKLTEEEENLLAGAVYFKGFKNS